MTMRCWCENEPGDDALCPVHGSNGPNEARVKAMARAAQRLAEQWGHQPWSDSWARLIAETMLDAQQEIERTIIENTRTAGIHTGRAGVLD